MIQNQSSRTSILSRIAGRLIVLTTALLAAGTVTASTELISVAASASRIPHDGYSEQPRLSGDGRILVFESSATNIVPGDTNGRVDIFLLDTVTQNFERLNLGPGGEQVQSMDSSGAQISADGRYVSFVTGPEFMPGTPGGRYLLDRQTGSRELLSIADNEQMPNAADIGTGFDRKMSDDARYTCFSTTASNLVPGDTNGIADVFLRDRIAGTTRLISVGLGNLPGNGVSQGCVVSNDGRFIGFTSLASNLVAADTNAASDAFLRDELLGTTTRISLTGTGAQIPERSTFGVINEDGSWMTFRTDGDGILPFDNDGLGDYFAVRRSDGEIRLVSFDVDGTPNGYSRCCSELRGNQLAYVSVPRLQYDEYYDGVTERGYLLNLDTYAVRKVTSSIGIGDETYLQIFGMAVSADLSTVAFSSNSTYGHGVTNLPVGGRNVYRRHFPTDVLTFHNRTANAVLASNAGSGGHLRAAAVDGSGRRVFFSSAANNLVTAPGNQRSDLYARDRDAQTTEWLTPDIFPARDCYGSEPLLSADARWLAMSSCWDSGKGVYDGQIVRLDRQTGQRTLASVGATGVPASDGTFSPAMSADGQTLAFLSQAENLVPGTYQSGQYEAFVRNMITGELRRVTNGTNGAPFAGYVSSVRLTSNGRWLALDSYGATVLIDLQAPVLTAVREPRRPNGSNPTNLSPSTGRVLDDSAQWLAFGADDNNLTGTAGKQVYVSFLPNRSFELVSKTDAGVPLFLASHPSISLDARFVAFQGQLTSVQPNQIFVRDRACNRLITVTPATQSGNRSVRFNGLELSADGSRLVFASNQSDLVANDGNAEHFDVFLSENYLIPNCEQLHSDGFE